MREFIHRALALPHENNRRPLILSLSRTQSVEGEKQKSTPMDSAEGQENSHLFSLSLSLTHSITQSLTDYTSSEGLLHAYKYIYILHKRQRLGFVRIQNDTWQTVLSIRPTDMRI